MVSQRTKQMVLNYIIKHPGSSDEEIAKALNLHILDVTVALLLLEEEGLVKEAKGEGRQTC